MDRSRGASWVWLMAPVALTLCIAAAVSGWVAFEGSKQSDGVQAADQLGADYLSEVATFRDGVASALEEVDPGDATALRAALKAAMSNPPTLSPIDSQSAESSATYREAEKSSENMLAPYRKLDRVLQRAQARQKFVDAGARALKADPTEFVSATSLASSVELRQRLIPQFTDERAQFTSIAVPQGAEACAQAVVSALDQIVNEATKLADSIDSGQNYATRLGTLRQSSAATLQGCKTRFDGDLAEAVTAVEDLAD